MDFCREHIFNKKVRLLVDHVTVFDQCINFFVENVLAIWTLQANTNANYTCRTQKHAILHHMSHHKLKSAVVKKYIIYIIIIYPWTHHNANAFISRLIGNFTLANCLTIKSVQQTVRNASECSTAQYSKQLSDSIDIIHYHSSAHSETMNIKLTVKNIWWQ